MLTGVRVRPARTAVGADVARASARSRDSALATTTTMQQTTTTPAAITTTTTEAVDPDAACIECHTDQEALLALAVEPEDAESLSSGEG